MPYEDFVTYGGESQDQVRAHMRLSTTAHARNEGKSVLMVSHGGATANFARAWEDLGHM